MNIILHQILILTAFSLMVVVIESEAKATGFPSLDNGSFGRIVSQNMGDEDDGGVEIGGGRMTSEILPTSNQWGSEVRHQGQDTLSQSELIKLLLQEIWNWKQKPPMHEVNISPAIPLRPVYGKRQIIYRQCFFNPISCF